MVEVPENEKTGPEVAILTQKKNSGEIPVARVWRPAAADGGRRWRMVAVATVMAGTCSDTNLNLSVRKFHSHDS